MRLFLKIAFAVVLACAAIEWVSGQQQQRGGFGGLQGLFGGKQRENIETLLSDPSVKKELNLSEEQEARVPAVMLEALGKVLDADQHKRLKQIELQRRDYKAFGDPNIQDALGMSETQKADIRTILADADKETQKFMADLQGGGAGALYGRGGAGGVGGVGGAGGGGMQDKIQSIARDTKEKCQEVLTASQRRAWYELLGDEFKTEQPKVDFKAFDFRGNKKG